MAILIPYIISSLHILLILIISIQYITVSSSESSNVNTHFNFSKNKHGQSSESNQTTCALFAGTWVRDDTYPIYNSSACSIIDPQFNCQMYGRPDSDYLKYRWKPLNCELPRFDGVEFLLKMRGKNVVFVGDSLGRNQWESLICMISGTTPRTRTRMIMDDPLSTFSFLDYGVTLSFHRAPYLVDIDVIQGKRVLKLGEISGNGKAWCNADVLLFNTGHWWTHKGSLQGWDLMESNGLYYKDMDRLVAMGKALRTWGQWVDNNINRTRSRVFFQSISPTHYNPTEWSVGSKTATTKNCYGETSPMSGGKVYTTGGYPGQVGVVDEVIRQMLYPPCFLDITMLSELRKDGHPSIYSGDLSPAQRAKPGSSADCSHWCLPGLPDTWNQLLYTLLFY